MKRYLVLSMIVLFLISGCAGGPGTKNVSASAKQYQTNLNNGDTTAPNSESSENIYSQYSLESVVIKLPSNWKINKPFKTMYYFIDVNGKSRGSISFQQYDANFNFQTIRPNHASLIKEEKIDIPLGQCSLYTMDADNGTAASGITGTHDDYYAIIFVKDKAIYTLEFSMDDKKPATKQMFINILKSLAFNESAALSTSSVNLNYNLEVRTLDHSTPQGVPLNGELWIIYSNGQQEKLVSPHMDSAPTKIITDIKTPMTSLDKTKVYFATSAWATSDAIHMVDLVTKSEKYVTDGSLLDVIKDGKYKGDILVEKSKLADVGGRYTEQVVVNDNGNEIAVLSKES